jgi:hypothetical protein
VPHARAWAFRRKTKKELHDQKVADIHHASGATPLSGTRIDDLMDDWCDSFVQMGEVAVKIFFDPIKGKVKGYDAQGRADGPAHLERDGQPQPDEEEADLHGRVRV